MNYLAQKDIDILSNGKTIQKVPIGHTTYFLISQLHYPAIAPIIKQHCKEYNLTYHELPTFSDALKAHLTYLTIWVMLIQIFKK